VRPKDRIVVISGLVQVESEAGRFTLQRRDYYDVPPSGAKLTNTGQSLAEVARVQGHWERTIRSEIYTAQPGNPCDYHYHDGNEYWMVFRGHFPLDYNGLRVPVAPGPATRVWEGVRARGTRAARDARRGRPRHAA
jgi:hypothetical protein